MVKFLLRLPDDLHAQLKELAKKDGRSLHNLIIYILQQWVIDRLEVEKRKK